MTTRQRRIHSGSGMSLVTRHIWSGTRDGQFTYMAWTNTSSPLLECLRRISESVAINWLSAAIASLPGQLSAHIGLSSPCTPTINRTRFAREIILVGWYFDGSSRSLRTSIATDTTPSMRASRTPSSEISHAVTPPACGTRPPIASHNRERRPMANNSSDHNAKADNFDRIAAEADARTATCQQLGMTRSAAAAAHTAATARSAAASYRSTDLKEGQLLWHA